MLGCMSISPHRHFPSRKFPRGYEYLEGAKLDNPIRNPNANSDSNGLTLALNIDVQSQRRQTPNLPIEGGGYGGKGPTTG